ncbi:pyridoxamine 5'-phosphate oxidase family protein [Sedimentibacter sp.]|uniref:pyridoxamine 5'-phosphate oxidase family protein n=1 Tax=Sedimentibacter sp. TaxID=1960295 RepID=UPI000EF0088E|nr:pyridoxamine 5'-phosphate oxidase family protein [Sedimentibacter sp.]HCX61640.1 MFS transporter [Clostridiales bacterium]
MFKAMRRKDRQLSDDESRKILEQGEYGVIGTIGTNGYPCSTPLNYVLEGDNIYVHFFIKGGNIHESINVNDKVAFTYVGKTEVLEDEFVTNYESVMVFGKAEIVDDEEKRHALVLIVEKYSPNFKKQGLEHIEEDFDKACVVKIVIEHITGKARRG